MQFKFYLIPILLVVISCKQSFKQSEYNKKLNRCFNNERAALNVYSLDNNIAKDELMYQLSENGIRYWKTNLKIIDSLSVMDGLSEEKTKYLNLYKEYNQKREDHFNLLLKTVQENTNKYSSEIELLDKEIVQLAEKVKNNY